MEGTGVWTPTGLENQSRVTPDGSTPLPSSIRNMESAGQGAQTVWKTVGMVTHRGSTPPLSSINQRNLL